MSGDYSRFTHDALQRYSALLLQQGRVLLDADFNEHVAIIKERIEKLSLDAMGNPGIPLLTNPDAFQVALVPGAPLDLALTPGRIYLDGLMAEIFEGETVTYLGQPFVPDPPPLPVGDAAIYLEAVWADPKVDVFRIGDPSPGPPDDFWQVVAGVHQMFDVGTGLYVLVEHLYNGNALGFGEGKAGTYLNASRLLRLILGSGGLPAHGF